MAAGTCPLQWAAAKALAPSRGITGIKEGTGLLPEVLLLVPGTLAYRRVGAGFLNMRGTSGRTLAMPCNQRVPEGSCAMALRQVTGLGRHLLAAPQELRHLGIGTSLLQGKVSPLLGCRHLSREEHQSLSKARHQQTEHQEKALAGMRERQETVLAGIRVRQISGFPPEPQGQIAQLHQQAFLSAVAQARSQGKLGQRRHSQLQETPQ